MNMNEMLLVERERVDIEMFELKEMLSVSSDEEKKGIEDKIKVKENVMLHILEKQIKYLNFQKVWGN